MKRKFVAAAFLLFPSMILSAGEKNTYRVFSADIYSGCIVKKIWLKEYAKPQIKLQDISYTQADKLPEDALPSDPQRFDVLLGMDRKKPFALIRIPAFISEDGKAVKQITEFTLDVEQKEAGRASAAKPTAVTNSVLASGTWHKVSVPATGLYKVDYNFFSSKMGVSGAISSSAIGVFGNGGRMISENNAIEHPDDLSENRIWINDGGDGTFGPGDYFIFYALGPDSWSLSSDNLRFTHTKNLYEDKSYYFFGLNRESGKRVETVSSSATPNTTITEFNDYLLHEQELYNPGALGKKWWGEDFGTTPGRVDNRTIELDLKMATSADFTISMGSRSVISSMFSIDINGQQIGTYALDYANSFAEDKPVANTIARWSGGVPNGKNTVKLTYQPGASDGIGYLDYIEVNMRSPLWFAGDQLLFRSISSVGAGKVASYLVANATGGTQVWDVTDPYNPVSMSGVQSGSTYTFTQDAATLHEFAAFKSTNLPSPEYVEKVENQNLHGSGPVDYIIVTAPKFANQAIELATFHEQRNGLRTIVASPKQVYNEFSSGSQDISAIRDLVKMFYDRAGNDEAQMPKYLLLFGDASYDYKDRIANNTNLVPTFEADESYAVLDAFCSDDFFGFLDDSENIENTSIINTLDIGVGRIPVKTEAEAKDVVNKIKHYKSPAALGPWRISTTIIADDEDNAGPHLEDGEIMDSTVIRNSDLYNSNKIYQDIIPIVSTPGGHRSPEANKAINDQIFKGTFLLNYNGHGNTQVLSHERILTQDDYSKWKNLDKLPFMVTATCDFSRFDHPDYVSAGERMTLKADGGVIAAVTTTQLVFQGPNRIINREYLDAQFKKVNGKWNTFGDAYRLGKNFMYSRSGTASDVVNSRKFTLLGDPALEPDFPEYNVTTEAVLDGYTGKPADSIKALGEYVIKGSVLDHSGSIIPDFNGRVTLTFFDKPKTVEVKTSWAQRQFAMRNSIVYRGKATVTDGKFSVTFIAPKDINYDFGSGKISYYAENGKIDGAGTDNRITVGGYSDNPVIEYDAPVVRPYIGDSLFRNGGLTGPNTLLYVILEDATGINVSGNSIGHDLTAVLDGDVAHPYVLNDYYETAPNTYKRGYVNFPLNDLAEGRHRLTVKAWDVNNNSGEGYVDFEVRNGQVVQVQNLMNYPNPFSDVTHFVFEHNHPDEEMSVDINIYTTGGYLVRTLKQDFTAGISRSNEIVWDGTSDQGAKLPAGVYIYRMRLYSSAGNSTTAYQKLVITR